MHRFASTAQIATLHFADAPPSTQLVLARRALARLRRLGLLGTLTRRIGGVRAGSAGLIHHLTERGHRLLARDQDQPRRRFHEPSPTFLAHTLAIGNVHVALAEAEQTGQLELVTLALETSAWRSFHQGFAPSMLKPDVYCELAAPPGNDELVAAFIEVDLGTEHLPTLGRKCRQYAAYAKSTAAADGMPLVVWSLTARDPTVTEHRRRRLAALIDRDAALDPAMFRITTPHQLIATLQAAAGQKGDAL